ncbi:MAG: hypothetical protein ACRCZP_13040 [Phycicoccus sp.]
MATAAVPGPDLAGTVLGALPDLGSLGGALALVVVVLRWAAAERAAWQAERAVLLEEARQARAELRPRDDGPPFSSRESG